MSTAPRGPHAPLALRLACALTFLGHGISTLGWSPLGSLPVTKPLSLSWGSFCLPAGVSFQPPPLQPPPPVPAVPWLRLLSPPLGAFLVSVLDPIPRSDSDPPASSGFCPHPCISVPRPASPLLSPPSLTRRDSQACSPLSHPPPLRGAAWLTWTSSERRGGWGGERRRSRWCSWFPRRPRRGEAGLHQVHLQGGDEGRVQDWRRGAQREVEREERKWGEKGKEEGEERDTDRQTLGGTLASKGRRMEGQEGEAPLPRLSQSIEGNFESSQWSFRERT